MIGIIDYGAGNLRSVCLAFDRCGAEAQLLRDPQDSCNVQALVLPGVGSFHTAMDCLVRTGWDRQIREQLSHGKKLIGICLGMQMLFEHGIEDGSTDGLGIIPGCVVPLDPHLELRIPHIGWNSVFWQQEHPVISGIRTGLDFYHVHSYHCLPKNHQHILAQTPYGHNLVTAVATDQVIGLQFHPEKSQPAGLKLLENFVEWADPC
jgi:glutamine amidotransferase